MVNRAKISKLNPAELKTSHSLLAQARKLKPGELLTGWARGTIRTAAWSLNRSGKGRFESRLLTSGETALIRVK